MKILNFIQDKLVTTFGIGLFFVSATWMLIEAISRQFFSTSFAISTELVVFSLVWAVLLTLGASGKKGYHVALDLFTRKFNKGVGKFSNILVFLVGIFYAGFILYAGVEYIDHLIRTGITSHSPLRLPMSFVFLSVPIGFFFLALYYLQSFINEFKQGRK
ncbi:TRAP transporter small permease [Lentibacillus jeotgali]|uniref:TRAP transporter small permease n=1 Tax=Lentibacillus jeotgali TaxID=558169 RepID=UPI00026283F9|nr:TRAP transporter small permease [Lentibacillus jeotgali]